MTWTVELAEQAEKQLKTLDPVQAKRILKFLFNRIEGSDDPRQIGEALRGSSLGSYWKYRVGDYRLICGIEDETVTVTVIKIGHRREVYR